MTSQEQKAEKNSKEKVDHNQVLINQLSQENQLLKNLSSMQNKNYFRMELVNCLLAINETVSDTNRILLELLQSKKD